MAGFLDKRTFFEPNYEIPNGSVTVKKLLCKDFINQEKGDSEISTSVVDKEPHQRKDFKCSMYPRNFANRTKKTVFPHTAQAMFTNQKIIKVPAPRITAPSCKDDSADSCNEMSSERSRFSHDSSQSENENGKRSKKGSFRESRLLNAALNPITGDTRNKGKLPYTFATTRKLLIRDGSEKEDNTEEKKREKPFMETRCVITTAVASPVSPITNRKHPRIANCTSLLTKTNEPKMKVNRFEKTGCCDTENKNSPLVKSDTKQKSEEVLKKLNLLIPFHRRNQFQQEREKTTILRADAYYDSHCHLDYIFNRLKKVEGNLNYWIQKYPEAFPSTFGGCFPNFIDPELFVKKLKSDTYDIEWIKSEIQNPKVVGCSFGCHPKYAALCSEDLIKTIDGFCQNFGAYKVKAIGECGLDFCRTTDAMEEQVKALIAQINLAVKYNLPLIIHCRSGTTDAEEPCLTVLASHKQLSRFHNIHRHCFTGSWQTAQKWISLFPNIYFGYTSACLNFHSNGEEMEALRNIPLDRILLETDAPYFKPPFFSNVPTGNIALPGMAISVADFLANARGLSLEAVIKQTTKNFARMYVFEIADVNYNFRYDSINVQPFSSSFQ